jgi:hypothetical protein
MSYQPTQTKLPGKGLIALGVVMILLGLAGGVALFLTGQSRHDSKVKSLATDSAALSGCITDLTFSKEGTFVLYYVYQGNVRVNGTNDGCAGTDTVKLSAASKAPDMDVTLTNSDGDTLKLGAPSSTAAVHAGGVRAVPYKQVTIKTTGDYQLEITAADGVKRFALGVGPKIDKADPLVAILVGVGGAALGLIVIVIGGVRRTSARRRLTEIPPPGVTGYPAQPGYGTAPGSQYPPGQYPPGQYPPSGQYPAPGQVSAPPAQYPAQPPYQPTQALPTIQSVPDGLGHFAPPTAGQPLPPPVAPAAPHTDDESSDS